MAWEQNGEYWEGESGEGDKMRKRRGNHDWDNASIRLSCRQVWVALS